MKNTIDVNCDLGEGSGNDTAIMPYIGSCNIACGGHAGDLESMRKTLALAANHQVKIGAHPSYPDRENFGRRIIAMSPSGLTQCLVEQIRLLENLASTLDLALHHIKLHGALYNLSAGDPATAQVIVEMMNTYFDQYLIYVPYPSVLSQMALQQHVRIKYEGFADRRYNSDLSLVGREHPHALILNQQEVLEQVERIVKDGQVKTSSGKLVSIQAETLCLHGDHPEAPEIAAAVHKMLLQEGHSLA